jgi:predicted nucleotidyltransferase
MNVFAWLDEASRTNGLSFVVIGGEAVNAHGYSRITRDLDLLISKTEMEKWVRVWETQGYRSQYDGGNFVQLLPVAEDAIPVDLMLVNEPTFQQMKAAAKQIQIEGFSFPIPCLDHLLALKFHALKHGPPTRGYKDLMDVLSLMDANQIDARSDKFRSLCDKYGDAKIYERILDFGQR